MDKSAPIAECPKPSVGLRAEGALPDFYIIGAPKCGTTTLYQWLSSHPECFMPIKEPGFFSQDIYSTYGLPTHISNLQAYRKIFSNIPKGIKVVGEATPKYLYSDVALNTIKRLRPDARMIVCLRDPVDLAISLHSQKILEAEESELDFITAWRRSYRGTCKKNLDYSPYINRKMNYVFWASYGRRLRKLFEKFPKNQIMVITLEDLKFRPDEIYHEIQEFLLLSKQPLPREKIFNAKRRVKWKRLHFITRILRRTTLPILYPAIRLRRGRGFGILKLIDKFNTESGKYSSEVPSSFHLEMYRTLSEDINLAESILKPFALTTGSLIKPSASIQLRKVSKDNLTDLND